MKVNGGPWDGDEVALREGQVGLVLHHRPSNRVWVYDAVDTPDGGQLDVREEDGRENDDEKRFASADDPQWMVRVMDEGEMNGDEVGR